MRYLSSMAIVLTSLASPFVYAQTIAFPGAEGAGRFAQGGRGGDVYHVTTLADSGTGSLREGIVSSSGPRTIVFEVGGIIELKSSLEIDKKSHVTIAGQTAPGAGITIKDYGIEIKDSSHLILRYLRLRLGDKNKKGDEAPDVISANYSDNLILDHISMSWAIDGIHDTRGCKNYTLQWSILGEALHNSIHPKGGHAMCASFRAPMGTMSIHHNLFTTSRDRHPTIGGSVKEPQWVIDFRNNVNYNWSGAANVCDNQVNLVNNYFKPGPETKRDRLPIALKTNLPDAAHGYLAGNFFEGRDDLTKNNYAAMDFETWINNPGSDYQYAGTVEDWKRDQPFDVGELPETQPAQEAYELVLKQAGASHKRDAVDERMVRDVREGTGKLLDSQEQVGGWPEVMAGEAPVDTDRDGMPDAWEDKEGFDKANAADRNGDADGDGFTNLEECLATRTVS